MAKENKTPALVCTDCHTLFTVKKNLVAVVIDFFCASVFLILGVMATMFSAPWFICLFLIIFSALLYHRFHHDLSPKKPCPSCGSRRVIPGISPLGKKILSDLR